MPTDILDTLMVAGVDQHELLRLLEGLFHHARMVGTHEVAYPNIEQRALTARFDRSGKLAALLTGPAMTSEALERLRAEVSGRLVMSTGIEIGAAVLFSHEPVQGYYEGPASTLHILPAPDHAPRPDVAVANHPFVIEFPVQASSDWFVTVSRRERQVWEWTWTLAALLNAEIQGIGPMMRNNWSAIPGEPGSTHPVRFAWLREGYGYDGFESRLPNYTVPECNPIALVPDAEYYSGPHQTIGTPLVLPASFPVLLLALARLQSEQRERWFRAARWLYTGECIRVHSYSAWFTSLVAAIEALAEQPSERRPCPCCGLDTAPGATRRFREFVDSHTGGPAQGSNAGRLYAMRSNFVHGRELAFWDEQPWHFGAMTSMTDQLFRNAAELTWTVRAVLINWLVRTLTASG